MRSEVVMALLGVLGLGAALGATARRRGSDSAPNQGPSRPPIDDYAAYAPQTQCLSSPRVGMVMFREWLLARFGQAPGAIENIMRSCESGGRSEHKEGRAWDWFPITTVDGDEAMAMLTANDNELARRAGIMFMIWRGQIWRSYPRNGHAAGQWGPYSGSNPHNDHVHFSLGWPGAHGETSLYQWDDFLA